MLRRLLSALLQRLAGPGAPWAFAGLAMLLCLPALWLGLQLDDYSQRLTLLEGERWGVQPLQLFAFFDGSTSRLAQYREAGVLPWWAPAGLKVSFCRPLSAALHWVDYRFWPQQIWLMHLHSLLWLGALVLAATLAYRRALGRGSAAALAALLFAVEDAHGIPAAWLANRNGLVAGTFGLLAVGLHLRARGDGRPGLRWLGAGLLFAGLLSGEMAVAAGGFLLAYALHLDPAPRGQALAALWPYGLAGGLWAVYYRLGGFGAAGSGVYLDPASEPVGFLGAFVRRLPVMLVGQWTPLPADLDGLLAPHGQLALRCAGYALLALLALLFAPLWRRDARARFWVTGMGLALLPIAGALPSGRTLLFVGFGACGLLALLAERWLAAGPQAAGEPLARWRRVATAALLVVHLPLAALALPGVAWSTAALGEQQERAFAALPRGPQVVERTLVVVQAPDYLLFVTTIPAFQRAHGLPAPARVRALAVGSMAAELSRPDLATLEVELAASPFAGPLGELFRAAELPFTVGEQMHLSDLRVEVLEVAPAGWPRRLRYRFPQPLEALPVDWVSWQNGPPGQGGELVAWRPPAVGSTVALPPARGPFEQLR